MEQTTTSDATDRAAQELIRPNQGRILAGVAIGLANKFNFPVLLIRIAFVLLAIAGGVGVVLYAAIWFLIRSEDETETPAQRILGGATSGRAWVGIGLVFIAAIVLLDHYTWLSGGIIWAIGLLVIGILLYTGDLPRLSKGESDTSDDALSKEGVQQMTTNDPRGTTLTKEPPVGGGTRPPARVPAPPILPPTPPKPREKSYLGRLTIGLMILAMGVLALLDNIEGVPVYPTPRHYMALAVSILGLGLLVGAFAGRARWLILVAVFMVPSLFFSPVFEWDWNDEAFDRTVAVDSFSQLEESYSVDVGNLVVDLSELPWDGEEVSLSATVDAGNLEVWVPRGVAITGEGSVDVGRVSSPARESSGIGSRTISFTENGDEGQVDLDLSVDVGNISVIVVDPFSSPSLPTVPSVPNIELP